MTKLYFRYSTMNSGKSTHLLQTAHNYEERGLNPLVLTPVIDDRYGVGRVTSRIGLQRNAYAVASNEHLLELFYRFHQEKPIDVVLVDEAQFLKQEQVLQLTDIVDIYNIPVFCYGLLSDFQAQLFEGSKALMIWADEREELKTGCWYCTSEASFNMRFIDGKPAFEGKQILIGGNGTYLPVCRKCYKEAIKNEKKQLIKM